MRKRGPSFLVLLWKTPGIVVPAVPNGFTVEVAPGGQWQWQRMASLYLGIHVRVFSTWTLGEKPTAQHRAFKESELLGFLCSCFDHTLTYFDLRADQAWTAAPETGKLKIPQQL